MQIVWYESYNKTIQHNSNNTTTITSISNINVVITNTIKKTDILIKQCTLTIYKTLILLNTSFLYFLYLFSLTITCRSRGDCIDFSGNIGIILYNITIIELYVMLLVHCNCVFAPWVTHTYIDALCCIP